MVRLLAVQHDLDEHPCRLTYKSSTISLREKVAFGSAQSIKAIVHGDRHIVLGIKDQGLSAEESQLAPAFMQGPLGDCPDKTIVEAQLDLSHLPISGE